MSKRHFCKLSVLWAKVFLGIFFYFDPYNRFIKFDHLLPGHPAYNVDNFVIVEWSLWDLSYDTALRVMTEEN